MTDFALWGTIVNTFAVLIGTGIGLGLAALSRRIAAGRTRDEDEIKALRHSDEEGRITASIQRGLGLCAALIGIQGALKVQNMMVMILSMVLGALVGELLDLDKLINRFGYFVEKRLKGKNGSVAQAFVTSTMLFCVGAMTVTGAVESALMHEHSTYYTKSMLDLVSSVVFSFSMGFGVILSAAGVFVIQGGLTLVAVLAAGALPAAITGEMIAVGSLLVIALGLNLLGVTKIKVMNYLPAMFFPIALCPLFELLPIF